MRRLGRVWALPLWAHTAALVVLLGALTPFMHLNTGSWVDDEGLYGRQVEALRDGRWEYRYGGEAFDPEHRWFPFPRVTHGEEGFYPYVKHPVFPVAVAQGTRVTGPGAGVFTLPVLGLVAAAVVAWMLAGETEPRGSRAAFWMVAASPQIVNAYTLWAHTWSAAIAGLAVWAGVRIVRHGPTKWNALGLFAALAAGALLRTEAILLAVALVFVIGAFLAWHRRLFAALAVVAGAGLVTGFAAVLERWWIGQIVGVTPEAPGFQAETAGRSILEILGRRLEATWLVTFDGGPVAGHLEALVVAALAVVLVAGLALRLRGREAQFLGASIAVVGGIAVVFLYGARFGEASWLSIPGLFAAWPVALFGLAALPWRVIDTTERVMLGVAALFAGAVFVVQYDVGGGREWGGRFLSPVVVPLAVVVAIGLVRRVADRRREQRVAILLSVVVLAAFPASRGIETVRSSREMDAVLQEVLTDVVVVDNPGLALAGMDFWRLDVDWYVSFGHAEELLDALADADVEEVTVFTNPKRDALQISSYGRAQTVTTPELEERGIPVVRLSEPRSGGG